MCVAKLRVDVTGAVVVGKTKKWAPYLITSNRINLCKDLTVAILDWQCKEIATILNHVKGFTRGVDRNSFQLRTWKRKKSAIQGNGIEASSKEIGLIILGES